jgi:hypothetical protein
VQRRLLAIFFASSLCFSAGLVGTAVAHNVNNGPAAWDLWVGFGYYCPKDQQQFIHPGPYSAYFGHAGTSHWTGGFCATSYTANVYASAYSSIYASGGFCNDGFAGATNVHVVNAYSFPGGGCTAASITQANGSHHSSWPNIDQDENGSVGH